MLAEAKAFAPAGITGVTSDLIFYPSGNLGVLSIGSVPHSNNKTRSTFFSTSADGQALYCQLDAGYRLMALT